MFDRIKTLYRRWQLRRQGFTVVEWSDDAENLLAQGFPIFESVEELAEYPKTLERELSERGRGGLRTEAVVEWR